MKSWLNWLRWFVFYLVLAAGAHTAIAHIGLDLGLTLGSGSVTVGPPASSLFLLANGSDYLLLANGTDKMTLN